ncbi:RNA 3'-terminal phosphate cyclase [Culicoides brevitarsis]|uniref:RNA 3'-terminal phosphate cyclase n=1 Tax=Culicoides brevitarsis TaxID=469753 RepID=UPI00307CC2DA
MTLEIDGSILEGGGQILRIALSLSALCRIPVRITKIRANRAKGGLAAQHLKGIELLRDICQANVRGAELGSSQIEFEPKTIRGGTFTADTKTAGSIGLLLQISLPVCLFADREVTLELKGGTNCEMAPQIDEMTEILRPNLEKFGATFDFDLLRRGYFPKGGGHCVIKCRPVKSLKAVEITNFGDYMKIYGWNYVAGTLPLNLAHDMANGAKNKMQNLPVRANIEVYKEDPAIARDNCSGIILCTETTTGCFIGSGRIGSRKESSKVTGEKAALEMLYATNSGACVDSHVQDQLIIFMALAKGTSRVRTLPLTLHTKTAIHVCELMTKAKFRVVEEGQTCVIECDGIGLENSN